MVLHMFISVETNGLSHYDQSTLMSEYEHCRLVEIGVELWDVEIQNTIDIYAKPCKSFVFSTLIKPNGWDIKNEHVRGISQHNAERNGAHIQTVLPILYTLICNSDLVISHNISFDMKLLLSEFARHNFNHQYDIEKIKNKQFICTSKMAYKRFKIETWTKLIDVYNCLFNEKKESNIRNVLEEIELCRKCYFRMMILK